MHYKINIFFILFTIYLQAEKIESITLGNWNGWFLAIEANNQVYLQYGSSPEDMAFSEDENIDLKNLYNEIKPLLKESWEDESFNDSGKTLKNDDLRKQTISVNVIKTNTNHSEKAQYLRKSYWDEMIKKLLPTLKPSLLSSPERLKELAKTHKLLIDENKDYIEFIDRVLFVSTIDIHASSKHEAVPDSISFAQKPNLVPPNPDINSHVELSKELLPKESTEHTKYHTLFIVTIILLFIIFISVIIKIRT